LEAASFSPFPNMRIKEFFLRSMRIKEFPKKKRKELNGVLPLPEHHSLSVSTQSYGPLKQTKER
jgi:hypothetical protein